MITVTSNTSRENIRRELNNFGFFSEIEVKKDNTAKDEVFFIREVGLLERLGKLFETKDRIKKRNLESKTALIEMTLAHPEIAGMLGNSAVSKLIWTAREFRQGIDLKKMPLQNLIGKKEPIQETKNLLITDAPLCEIKNFPQVGAMFTDKVKVNNKNFQVESDNNGVKISTQWNTQKDDLKPLYSEVMRASSGTFAMALVPDRSIKNGVSDRISDENIDAFLEALDEFEENQKTQSKKRQVILSADGDPQLYQRIIDRKLAHDAIKKAKNKDGKLAANDLLKLPASSRLQENHRTAYADDGVLVAIENDSLEPTPWDQVYLLTTDCPAYVPADRSMISVSSLSSSKRPDGAAAPIAALARGLQDSANEFEWNKVGDEPVFKMIDLPADELPTSELVGFIDNLELDQYRYQDTPANKYEDFYKNLLKNSTGTVVLECPLTSSGCAGLRQALDELKRENSLPQKLVLVASEADFPMAKIRFQHNNSSAEAV